MNNYDENEIVNVGLGEDISIRDLAYMIKEIVGYQGELVFDATKPEGMPKKLLDVSKIHAIGWRAQEALESGIRKTYAWYLDQE